MEVTLTAKQRMALKAYWNMPIRVKGETVEAKKGDCWGILYYTIQEAQENANILIERSK